VLGKFRTERKRWAQIATLKCEYLPREVSFRRVGKIDQNVTGREVLGADNERG